MQHRQHAGGLGPHSAEVNGDLSGDSVHSLNAQSKVPEPHAWDLLLLLGVGGAVGHPSERYRCRWRLCHSGHHAADERGDVSKNFVARFVFGQHADDGRTHDDSVSNFGQHGRLFWLTDTKPDANR